MNEAINQALRPIADALNSFIFFEVSIFAIIALLISRLGPTVVAGHQVALNFTSLVFMVPLSLALAVTVRVGMARGAGNRAGLQQAIASAWWLTSLVGIVAAGALLLFRQQIPLLYSDNVEVRTLASRLLLFAALYQLSDAWQVATNGILRGFEDTAMPMLFTLLAYWGIGLPVGYILGLTDWWRPAMGPDGFWIGLIAGLTAAALLLTLRLLYQLRRGKAAPAGDENATQATTGDR